MLLLLSAALATDCAVPTRADALAEESLAVRTALEAGDPQRFADGLGRLDRAVACLADVADPAAMATWRMVRGIRAVGEGDSDLAAAEFLAARALDPGLTLPVYPADHTIQGVARRHDPIRAPRARLPAPRRGELYVDGYQTRERYAVAPALVQRLDDGRVDTFAVPPGEIPQYPYRHPIRDGLIATTAGFTAAGATLIALSGGPRSQFLDGDATSVAELTRLRSQTNTLAGAGVGALGAAVVAGVGAVVFRER